MNNIQKTIRSYMIGFGFSLALTFLAYITVLLHESSYSGFISQPLVLATIIAIAFVQLFVQSIFFLHVGQGPSSRWNVVIFMAAFSAILVIVVGSIWIMNHLNYNMTPQQILQYVQDQSGF